jgi:hypothetical protein
VPSSKSAPQAMLEAAVRAILSTKLLFELFAVTVVAA